LIILSGSLNQFFYKRFLTSMDYLARSLKIFLRRTMTMSKVILHRWVRLFPASESTEAT